MKSLLLTAFSLIFAGNAMLSTAFCQTYNAAQGEVLRLVSPLTGNHLQVRAFGQNWPIYRQGEQNIAWIGIHLKSKPATYPILWTMNDAANGDTTNTVQFSDAVHVSKGDFRLSHIKVKKSMSSFSAKNLKRLRQDQQDIKTAYRTPVSMHNPWPEMIWPVEGIISTPFAAQRFVNGKPRSPHSGIDIAAAQGTPVRAPLAGVVLLVSDMYLNGNLVAIGHGDGFTTVYAHLKKSLVKEGQQLQAGEIFAEVGSTGRSTGAHLHWGVHFKQAKINPASMLNRSTQQLAQQQAQASNGVSHE